ncbi:MAG: HAMP domain-containing histidine kinase [Proteobacteria bacterium]|nr:HAMP domain-containing histidine kinase [Pseudomonadota bacterium]MDE3207379.1 HAMP domain-containing histidine kinase [Pseudomonadota bacterium]
MIDKKALEQAFTLFNQVSADLTRSYSALSVRIEALKGELAEANVALRKELVEKEALSRRLALLLSSLPAGVLVLDQSGKVIEANPAARTAFRDVETGAEWTRISQNLQATQTPHEWIDNQGRRFSLMTAVMDPTGEQVILINDITEDYVAKEKIERSQRLLAMGEMVASLAHQIRTPLSTAILYTAHLGKEKLDFLDRQRFVQRLRDRLLHLETLVGNMLLFVRGEQLEQSVFHVSELLESVKHVILPHFENQKITLTIQQNQDVLVKGNLQSLVGVMVNLLENALAASAPGKTVRLAAFSGEEVILSVEDEGYGMSEETRSRLFEPFFTTRANGTGLGLAIVQQIIGSMGGHVKVSSQLGQGSSFSIHLPNIRE